MADKRISQLDNGVTATTTDVFPIERGSTSNYRLTLQNVLDLVATYTFPTLGATTLTTTDETINGRLGVGVAFGTYKLNVYQSSANTDATAIRINSISTSASFISCRIGATGSDSEYGNIGSNGTDFLFRATNAAVIYTAGSQRFIIDSSGRAALSLATPYSWSAYPVVSFDLGQRATISADYTSLNIGTNCYYNGGWKYKQTAAASYISLGNGVITFNTAPSGSAGAAISWTTSLSIDTSGTINVPSLTSTTQATSNNTTAVATTAFVKAAMLGSPSQTWVEFDSTSRAKNTTYTNNTDRPIFVSLGYGGPSGDASYTLTLYAGSTTPNIIISQDVVGLGNRGEVQGIIPVGWSYKVTQTGANTNISFWAELR